MTLATRVLTAALLLGSVTPTRATTFSNPASIIIKDNPELVSSSSLTVSGMPGVITSLNVSLSQVTSPSVADLDFLLVGPGGQTFIVLSDCGGASSVSNVTVMLADAGASLLPRNAVFGSATFGSVFGGLTANGTWTLYAVDDQVTSGGSTVTGGWSLDVTTASLTATTTSVAASPNPSFTAPSLPPR